jgi:hypothetical protein
VSSRVRMPRQELRLIHVQSGRVSGPCGFTAWGHDHVNTNDPVRTI